MAITSSAHLDSVVHQFRTGATPESILRSFPLIRSLERVNGVIVFYLARQSGVDEYFEPRSPMEKLSWGKSVTG
jgi:hypothetical protein